mgnify:CR=1 FL=1
METGRQTGVVSKQQPVLCKPNKQCFQLVLDQVGASPSSTIFIDDSVRNVAAAHEMGIFSVLVSPTLAAQQSPHQQVAGADLVVSGFNQLREVLPQVRALVQILFCDKDAACAQMLRHASRFCCMSVRDAFASGADLGGWSWAGAVAAGSLNS